MDKENIKLFALRIVILSKNRFKQWNLQNQNTAEKNLHKLAEHTFKIIPADFQRVLTPSFSPSFKHSRYSLKDSVSLSCYSFTLKPPSLCPTLKLICCHLKFLLSLHGNKSHISKNYQASIRMVTYRTKK